MSSGYHDPSHLAQFRQIGANRPELADKFFDYYGAVMGDGALPRREKALIALAVAAATAARGGGHPRPGRGRIRDAH